MAAEPLAASLLALSVRCEAALDRVSAEFDTWSSLIRLETCPPRAGGRSIGVQATLPKRTSRVVQVVCGRAHLLGGRPLRGLSVAHADPPQGEQATPRGRPTSACVLGGEDRGGTPHPRRGLAVPTCQAGALVPSSLALVPCEASETACQLPGTLVATLSKWWKDLGAPLPKLFADRDACEQLSDVMQRLCWECSDDRRRRQLESDIKLLSPHLESLEARIVSIVSRRVGLIPVELTLDEARAVTSAASEPGSDLLQLSSGSRWWSALHCPAGPVGLGAVLLASDALQCPAGLEGSAAVLPAADVTHHPNRLEEVLAVIRARLPRSTSSEVGSSALGPPLGLG